VRLVRDDEVEEADVEVLEALHHGGVGRQIDSLVPIARGRGANDHPGLSGHELLEDAVGLLSQLPAITQE
jgi:hypothetical protein